MRRFSPALLLAASALAFTLAPALAFACAPDEDAVVTWNLSALSRSPEAGPATVSYAITQQLPPPPVCIPDEEPCTPPAPIVVEGTIDVPFDGPHTAPLPAGDAELVVELDGYEPVLIDRLLCGAVSIRAALLPTTPVTLTLTARTWADIASPEGTVVRLDGVDDREGEHYEGTLDADGTLTLSDITPGFYRLDAWQPLGNSHERVTLDFVDLLGDSSVSLRLRSSVDLPGTSTNCAAMGGASSLWGMAAAFFLLLLLTRRRRDA